jgi:ATP-dependent Clp protease ATP-binding subunit ClpX
LIKQYTKLFEFDQVELEIEPAALYEIAGEAIKRKTGARALRAIFEQIMLEVMYEVPSAEGIKKVLIPAGVITEGNKPQLLGEGEIKRAS